MDRDRGNGAYIVSGVRTPVGKADRGALRNVRPEDMGALVLNEAIARVPGLEPSRLDDVLVGCAFPEGPQGMNLGRIVAQRAGLPHEVPGATINRFCSSGLQTIALATQAIRAGHADVVAAGGVESMSMVPMTGFFFQPNPEIVDSNVDVYISMGITAENVAKRYGISREDQDRFALQSHQRALEAVESGRFDTETIAVPVEETAIVNGAVRRTETSLKRDEGPRADTSLEALAKLKPVFSADGTVTAGNASQRSDGAAMTIVVSSEVVKELELEPIGRLIGFALAGVPPELMGIGPIEAIRKVLRQTGLELEDIGLVELNEAFASQSIAVIRETGLDEERVNVNGGAVALGHPLGCTGTKLSISLLNEMVRRNVRYGICTMCVGGGMGAAGVFENLLA
ncbi:MAG TPA: thiolase family protein [Rhodothermales bacterium]